MDKDTIIQLAREAGLHIATDVAWMPIIGLDYAERFATLVAAHEREECASILDDAIGATIVAKAEIDPQSGDHIYDQNALEIVLAALSANVSAIRSRT